MYILQKDRHTKCRNDTTQKDGAIYTGTSIALLSFWSLLDDSWALRRAGAMEGGIQNRQTFSIFLDGDKA